MYPADHDWGDGSDLPDAVTLTLAGADPVDAIRSGVEFVVDGLFNWNSGLGTAYFKIVIDETWGGGPAWRVQYRFELGDPWEYVTFVGPCLITGDGSITAGDDTVEDQFSGTYTVGATTLTRASLCQWTGGGRTLQYNSTALKFQLDGVNKTGDQNEPNGTYGPETVT